jgi:hypothetical protein
MEYISKVINGDKIPGYNGDPTTLTPFIEQKCLRSILWYRLLNNNKYFLTFIPPDKDCTCTNLYEESNTLDAARKHYNKVLAEYEESSIEENRLLDEKLVLESVKEALDNEYQNSSYKEWFGYFSKKYLELRLLRMDIDERLLEAEDKYSKAWDKNIVKGRELNVAEELLEQATLQLIDSHETKSCWATKVPICRGCGKFNIREMSTCGYTPPDSEGFTYDGKCTKCNSDLQPCGWSVGPTNNGLSQMIWYPCECFKKLYSVYDDTVLAYSEETRSVYSYKYRTPVEYEYPSTDENTLKIWSNTSPSTRLQAYRLSHSPTGYAGFRQIASGFFSNDEIIHPDPITAVKILGSTFSEITFLIETNKLFSLLKPIMHHEYQEVMSDLRYKTFTQEYYRSLKRETARFTAEISKQREYKRNEFLFNRKLCLIDIEEQNVTLCNPETSHYRRIYKRNLQCVRNKVLYKNCEQEILDREMHNKEQQYRIIYKDCAYKTAKITKKRYLLKRLIEYSKETNRKHRFIQFLYITRFRNCLNDLVQNWYGIRNKMNYRTMVQEIPILAENAKQRRYKKLRDYNARRCAICALKRDVSKINIYSEEHSSLSESTESNYDWSGTMAEIGQSLLSIINWNQPPGMEYSSSEDTPVFEEIDEKLLNVDESFMQIGEKMLNQAYENTPSETDHSVGSLPVSELKQRWEALAKQN